MKDTILKCKNLNVAIASLQLLNGLDLEVQAGDFVSIIGCNGAGKSTLIHTLAGLHHGDGDVTLMNNSLAGQTPMQIAQSVALLTQKQTYAFPATVFDTVLMGRHPHLGFWQWEGAHDIAIVEDCLAKMDLTGLAQRNVEELSGGERQRVAIAAVLAQEASLYLLDEPLNNLDPKHQLRVLNHFQKLSRNGAAVITILHDLNLVWRFANKVLCLHGPMGHGRWQSGTTDECLSGENLSHLYQTPIQRLNHAGQTIFIASD